MLKKFIALLNMNRVVLAWFNLQYALKILVQIVQGKNKKRVKIPLVPTNSDPSSLRSQHKIFKMLCEAKCVPGIISFTGFLTILVFSSPTSKPALLLDGWSKVKRQVSVASTIVHRQNTLWQVAGFYIQKVGKKNTNRGL